MRRRAYRAVAVNDVDCESLSRGRDGQGLVVGVDMSKRDLKAVACWSDRQFERPWRAANPGEIPEFVRLLAELGRERSLLVAMEPSGTYGDALRQALTDAHIAVHRVSPKAAHDHAEIFDGVPSQHDGKDAAVVADLAAQGRSSAWPYQPASIWEQELKYWVDWMDAHQRVKTLWLGRLEALLARHWPEATQLVKVSSQALLRALAAYGGPADLSADPAAVCHLRRWSFGRWSQARAKNLWASACTTLGVRTGAPEIRLLRHFAEEALRAQAEVRQSGRQLRDVTKKQSLLQAQACVVGIGTASVLWVCLGDPRHYHCAQAYRKAMGLNLVERSSGKYHGHLRISKRGHPLVRHWLYLAALRQIRKPGVQQWYVAKATRDGNKKKALIGVARRLALALYHVAVRGAVFSSGQLFPGTSPGEKK